MHIINRKRIHFTVALVAAGLMNAIWGIHLEASDSITLEVAAGDYRREGTLVSVKLPKALREHKHFTLTRLDTLKSVPVQVDRSGKTCRAAWIIGDPLEAGKVRRYRLSSTEAHPDKTGGVTVEKDDKHLTVKVGRKPVLRYNHAVIPSPDPKTPYYARSGYIHPIFSPAGKIVTDDFNPDHAHQHGVMFAWRKSKFEGHAVNCWEQKNSLGKVEHVEIESSGDGPVFGHFTACLRHVSNASPDGPKTMLDETWQVRVVNAADNFLFDVVSTQNAHSASPLFVEKVHYGGFAIRGAAPWCKHRGRDHDFLTSEGKTKKDGNHTRPRWVDIQGKLDGQTAGVAIMCHPDNFRFPQPVRLHPYMPYFCFAPAVLDSFKIEQGKPFVSRYRFCVHDGDVEPAVVERLWQDYAEPPVVRVVPES